MRMAILGAVVFFAWVGAACGQNVRLDDPPKIFIPKKPPTRQELDRHESLRKYAAGLVFERADRYQDALTAYEEAARLDPDAPAVVKAQVPILVAMQRLHDALDACKKVVALDPGDYSSWYAQAKLLRRFAKYAEAAAALQNAVKSTRLDEHPEASQQIYFELGELFETTNQFGPAADAFNKAAAILEHPDRIMRKGPFPREAIQARAAETYEKISYLYRKAKQYDQALAALKKAQERSPLRAELINHHLAELCEEQGDIKQAMTYLDAYLRTRPLSLDAYEKKIDLLRRLKQADAIVPWLEEVAGRDKNHAGLQCLLAKEYANAKQNQKAETLYRKLAEESPNGDVYRGLFQLYKLDGPAGMRRILVMLDKFVDKAAAEDGPAPLGVLQQGRAIVGALRGDADLAQKLVAAAFRYKDNANGELKFDTRYFLAQLADRHRMNAEAERFYRQCLADKAHAAANEAILYDGLLRALARAKKYEAVVSVCKQAKTEAARTSPLLFLSALARAQASLHRYDDALRTADEGIEKAGERKLFFQTLRARILVMAERYPAAEAECQKLIKDCKRPDDVIEIRYTLSGVYSASKQPAKSEEQLQAILKIDPLNATASNDLGYLWADQKRNLEQAEDLIRKAIDLDRAQRRRSTSLSSDGDKDHAAYIDSLGWILFRRGQIEEARRELERATKLDDGDDPVIYDHLGDVYDRLHMNPDAVRAWQRSIELYDNGIRGKDEDRVRDLRRKIEKAQQEIGGR